MAGNTTARPRCFMDFAIEGQDIGRVVFELFSDVNPRTCENFRSLCTGSSGVNPITNQALYYKGSSLHRIIAGFMVQGGDFTTRNGKGGESIYGGTFDDEDLRRTIDQEGLLVMANKGKNTNGSQFFVSLRPCPHLDGKHVVFGRVVKGYDVIEGISKVAVTEKDVPHQLVTIANCGELELRKGPVAVARPISPVAARSRSASLSYSRSRSRSSSRSRSGSPAAAELHRSSKRTKPSTSSRRDDEDRAEKSSKRSRRSRAAPGDDSASDSDREDRERRRERRRSEKRERRLSKKSKSKSRKNKEDLDQRPAPLSLEQRQQLEVEAFAAAQETASLERAAELARVERVKDLEALKRRYEIGGAATNGDGPAGTGGVVYKGRGAMKAPDANGARKGGMRGW